MEIKSGKNLRKKLLAIIKIIERDRKNKMFFGLLQNEQYKKWHMEKAVREWSTAPHCGDFVLMHTREKDDRQFQNHVNLWSFERI